MSDELKNVGRKGYCMMWFVVFIILFISLWAYLYYSNFDGLPS